MPDLPVKEDEIQVSDGPATSRRRLFDKFNPDTTLIIVAIAALAPVLFLAFGSFRTGGPAIRTRSFLSTSGSASSVVGA